MGEGGGDGRLEGFVVSLDFVVEVRYADQGTGRNTTVFANR